MSEDGLTLTLNTAGENGSKSEVVYSVQEGLLTRSEDGADLKLVAKFDALRFSIQQKRLVAEWNSGDRKEIENWALDRWGTP